MVWLREPTPYVARNAPLSRFVGSAAGRLPVRFLFALRPFLGVLELFLVP